ncbi:APC family permease [Leeia oryzae]|uniref:APC family permease n=1 Tax=Leeia oryzae TaxID=356662 RepID=UPI0003680AE2|nr:APC family permease [Leeia oryzae]
MSQNQTVGQLKGSLGIMDVVMITVSGVTPASSIFVIAPFAIQSAGSGSFLSFVFAGILAAALALCYAELGAAHPSAGGEYTIIQRLFGRTAGLQMYLFVLCMLLFIPAVLATGAATYLNSALGTHFDSASVALVIVVLSYAIGVLDIKTNALLTGAFLGLELLVLAIIGWLGFSQQHQATSILLHPQMPDAKGVLTGVPFGVIIAMVGTALFSYNGYGAAIYLAEDMHKTGKPLAIAILLTLVIVILMELLPMTALLLGAPSLETLAKSADPISYVITQLGSPGLARVISAGIFLSVFNAIIAIVVQNARFLFASGRDGMWTARLNKALVQLHPRFGTPWVATLLFAAPSALLTFNSNLGELTSFTVIILLLAYISMAIASLFSRHSETHHPYLMPLWPVPSLLVLAGSGYTLWTILQGSSTRDLVIVTGIIVAGLLMSFTTHRARKPATAST